MIDRSLFLSADGQTFDGRRAVPSEAVTALMLSLADLKLGEKVLEIGTGSGYQTCCLAEAVFNSSAKHKWEEGGVVSLDVEPLMVTLHDKANFRGAPVWQFNAACDPEWIEEELPFDCIFVTCGMTSIPPAYEEQLREGGRLIIPLGKPDGQELLRLEKRSGKLVMGRIGGYCRFQMAI